MKIGEKNRRSEENGKKMSKYTNKASVPKREIKDSVDCFPFSLV